MATLSELRRQGDSVSLKRGTTQRSLGGKSVVPTTDARKKGGAVEQFVNKVGAVAGQTASLGADLASRAGRFVVNTGVDVGRQAKGAFYALNPQIAMIRQTKLSNDIRELDRKQSEIMAAYKSGRMSRENYTKSLKLLSSAYQDFGKQSQRLQEEADPVGRASDVAWTAINVVSAGGALLVRQAVKQSGSHVARRGLQKTLDDAVVRTENAIMRVPAGKQLLERNASKVVARAKQKVEGETTEQWLARNGRDVVVGLLIKRPLFYQQNIGLANEAYKKILDGQFDDAATPAAWLGVQMIGGGPLLAGIKYMKTKTGELARGKGSVIDEISKQIGGGNPNQVARFLTTLEKKAPNEFKEAERTFRILQHSNLAASGDNVSRAADNVLLHYREHGYDLTNVTPAQIYRDMNNWAKADELRQSYIKKGMLRGIDPSEADKYAVVRWDSTAKDGLIRSLADEAPSGDLDLNTRQALLDKVTELGDRAGVGWGNNEILLNRIQTVVAAAFTFDDIAKGIKQIDTAAVAFEGVPKKIAREFSDLGYTIAAPFGGNRIDQVDYSDIAGTTKKIITGAIKKDSELFDAAVAPQPVLRAISGALAKSGLSPEGNLEIGNKKLSEALIGNLGELEVARPVGLRGSGDFVNGGRAILSQLQRYVETKKGAPFINKISSGKSAVTDIRQLTNDEIATALGITQKQAGDVSRAIRRAYTEVPLEFRGIGDKIVDYTINMPFSPMRYYQRVQSALRYTYNPFFRFQEQVESAALASMNANKFIWAHRGLDDTVRKLEQSGAFDGNVFGAGADDAVFGRISANLTKFQKRNLAGLAETIAKGQGKTIDEVLRDNPEQIEDALRVIVQYPRKGGLASPLARTVNLAFFPMRYNAKVATLAAEKLATLPPSIQFATIQGIYRMKEWLKSDEGLAWQAEHADAIQVWSWATPVGNISQFYRLLAGNVNAPGELGLLGGLPFGVISQVLDSQGIININTPYVNPKTGDVIPDYIPQTTRARAAVALQDLIGTMFSFPGRTLGLPGKEENLRKAVGLFIDTNGRDFYKRIDEENLTELQRNMIRVLKGDTSDEVVSKLFYAPADGQFDYYTIPPMTVPVRPMAQSVPPSVQRRKGLPTKADLRAAKRRNSGRDPVTGKKVKPLPKPITR